MTSQVCTGDPIADALCQTASGIGSSVFAAGATSALDATSAWVATGASWFLAQVGGALGSSTAIDLSAPWFLERYRAIEALLAVVALPVLLLAVIGAVLRQDLGLLIRMVLVQLPLGMLLAGAAVELTTLGLGATDQLCRAVAGPTGAVLRSLTSQVATALVGSSVTGGSATPAFVLLLAAAAVALAGLALWLELVIRAAAIYVAVAFLPLVLVTMVWPALASWSRRLAETLVALVLSKLVIVVVLTMAVGALGTRSDRSFATVVSGLALLTLAAFAPFSLLRLLPLAEAGAVAHLEGLRQRGTRAVAGTAGRRVVDVALAAAGGPAALGPTAPMVPTPNGPPVGVRSTANPIPGDGPNGPIGPPPTRPAPGPGGSGGSTPTSTGPAPTGASPTMGPAGRSSEEKPTTLEPTDARGPLPTRPAPSSSIREPMDRGRLRWPRDDPPDDLDPAPLPPPSAPPSRRPPSLVIGRDATGPVIRPARPEDHGDAGSRA